jgi:very-short-patch-repair endonuclease
MRVKTQIRRLIVDLAERQHGVAALHQLLTLGLSRDAIYRYVRDGWLHHVHQGVYAVGRRTLTPSGHRMAAVLACGPSSFLSHNAAAAHWAIRASSHPVIDVTVAGMKRASRPRIRAHYTKALHPEDTTILHSIPITSPARTLLDLAAGLKPEHLVKAIEEAERQRIFDLLALDRAIARTPRRRGTKKLREVLAAYREPPDTHSHLEQRFYELIRNDPTIPDPQVNVMVAGLEVDFFWPATRLVVELDSRSYHANPRAFENDRVRDARLLRAHCHVLRITHQRMRTDSAGVLADVRSLSTPPRE